VGQTLSGGLTSGAMKSIVTEKEFRVIGADSPYEEGGV
jgi:hypothetical protein